MPRHDKKSNVFYVSWKKGSMSSSIGPYCKDRWYHSSNRIILVYAKTHTDLIDLLSKKGYNVINIYKIYRLSEILLVMLAVQDIYNLKIPTLSDLISDHYLPDDILQYLD
jgi:hypothetical protein